MIPSNQDPIACLCLAIAVLALLNVLRMMVGASLSAGTARGFKRDATAKVIRVRDGQRIRGIVIR
jgi:hypothetical protein